MGEYEDYNPAPEREYWRKKYQGTCFERDEFVGNWPPESGIGVSQYSVQGWHNYLVEQRRLHRAGQPHDDRRCKICQSQVLKDYVQSDIDAVQKFWEMSLLNPSATNNTHTAANATREEEVTSIKERKAALARQAEALMLRLDVINRIPEENPFEEGDVFRLTKKWGQGDEYTYAGVFVAGKFYTTGMQSNTRKFDSWDAFINWAGEAGEAAVKIEKATAWENVIE